MKKARADRPGNQESRKNTKIKKCDDTLTVSIAGGQGSNITDSVLCSVVCSNEPGT